LVKLGGGATVKTVQSHLGDFGLPFFLFPPNTKTTVLEYNFVGFVFDVVQ
jgi:hypothetical protein